MMKGCRDTSRLQHYHRPYAIVKSTMLKVIETFSGIGAQAKALSNIGADFKIIGTADWDIHAMIAYDLIHHGKQDLSKYENATREEMLKKLKKYTLSIDGKVASDWKNIKILNMDVLRRVCAAIDRTNNYVSVTDMDGALLPADMDALTYSFPCQDLSIGHAWHGATEGIDRRAANRSSQLWEIERILQERKASPNPMPKFLLMENVPNIISRSHSKNFDDWKQSLVNLGYYNKFYVLVSSNFGTPQVRKRAYLMSFYTGGDEKLEAKLDKYFAANNLEDVRQAPSHLSKYLRTDYEVGTFAQEAMDSQPNDTPSRRDIFEKSVKLFNGVDYSSRVPTITTKQDRRPNSGVINYDSKRAGKSTFRYLTARECLLLMGFEDRDYEVLVRNNFKKNSASDFFTSTKITKMAGNSIVVPVLEAVFEQMLYVDQHFLSKVSARESAVEQTTLSRGLSYAISPQSV
jgi:DNA (cytosine-5)-methyltransferase 1